MSGEDSHHAEADMHIDAQRAKLLAENVAAIQKRMSNAGNTGKSPRLVLVSKLKPANDILALSRPPTNARHFGENYAQELQSKAAILPADLRWHFIGALQTNKCKPLAENVPNLWCVSSVDSSKKADALEKGRQALAEKQNDLEPLRVQVQVNTSGEEQKSGVEPGSDTTQLCKHIRDNCPNLRLSGLMTIGAIARSKATTEETENEDFIALMEIRNNVAEELGIGADDLELGMGMSSDFESAIRLGSDEVRVGSSIFGERPAKGDAKIKEDVAEGT